MATSLNQMLHKISKPIAFNTELDRMCNRFHSECGPVITRNINKENDKMNLEYGITKDELAQMKSKREYRGKGSKYLALINEFLESGNEVAKVNSNDGTKPNLIQSSMYSYIKKNNLPCQVTRMKGSVYLVRKDE